MNRASMSSCDKHTDCVVVYDDYFGTDNRGKCPICVLEQRLEEAEALNNTLIDEAADLRSDIRNLKEELDEFRGPSERED